MAQPHIISVGANQRLYCCFRLQIQMRRFCGHASGTERIACEASWPHPFCVRLDAAIPHRGFILGGLGHGMCYASNHHHTAYSNV